MANGDKAAALGFPLVAETDDRRRGYDEINVSRDLLADHITDGTHRANQITSGTLVPARGGTGRGNVFSGTEAATASPAAGVGNRLVVVRADGTLSSLTGEVSDAYMGRRVVGGTFSANFSALGGYTYTHNLGWAPTAWSLTPRLDISSPAITLTRTTGASSTTQVGIRAWFSATGDPYTGNISTIEFIAWGDV